MAIKTTDTFLNNLMNMIFYSPFFKDNLYMAFVPLPYGTLVGARPLIKTQSGQSGFHTALPAL